MSQNYILWPVAKAWLPWLPSYDLIGWFCLCRQGSSIWSPNLKSIPIQRIKLQTFQNCISYLPYLLSMGGRGMVSNERVKFTKYNLKDIK